MQETNPIEDIGSKLINAAWLITAASLFAYVVAYIKSAMVAAYLGTSWAMDVFLWSFAIIYIFSTFANGPISAVLVPVYISLKAKDTQKARDFLGSVLGFLILSFTLLSLVLIVIMPAVANWLGGALGADGRLLAIRLSWMMIPVVLFSGVWAAVQAILNAEKSFLLPALSASFPAMGILLLLVIGKQHMAVSGQALGLSIGTVFQFVILYIALHRRGIYVRWSLNLHVEGMQKFWCLIWPLIISQIFLVMIPIVDRTLGFRFSAGSISALNYAQTIMTMSATMFMTALYTAILPFFSQQIVEGRMSGFKRTFVSTIRVLLVTMIPISVLVTVLESPVVRILFERGAFDAQATHLTAPAIGANMLGVVPMAIIFISSRAFNALEDSKTNALLGTGLLVSVKLITNFIFITFFGYIGLALGSSASFLATAVAMLFVLHKRLGGLDERQLLTATMKSTMASIVGGGLAWFGMHLSGSNPFIQVFIGGSAGLIGFILVSYLLKLEDIQMIFVSLYHSLGRLRLEIANRIV